MKKIILSFHIVKEHLSNFIILYDVECHLNSIFLNAFPNKFLLVNKHLIEQKLKV